MKIGIMLDKISPGGVSKAALEEVRHLRKFGYDAELVVIMRDPTNEYRFEDLRKGVPITYLSDHFPQPFKKSIKFPGFSFFSTFHVISPFIAPHITRVNDFDILVSHGTYTCFTAIRLWQHKAIPYIGFIHDPISYILTKVYSATTLGHLLPVLGPIGYLLDKKIVENSRVTVTNSSVHKNFLERVANKNIEIVYPGGNPVSRIPKKRGNYVLAVGRWGLNKRPDMFIDIWKRLDTKMKLVVSGFWAKKSVWVLFAKRVKAEGLEKWVDIRGPTDEEQLIKMYTGARVLIHPLFEAFGMIALEAAGCGCPFIIPRGSGVTDLFIHGVHGFFPKEGYIEAYTDHLNQLISDERLAWKMGYDAWKIAQKNDYENHTKQLEDVILRYYQ